MDLGTEDKIEDTVKSKVYIETSVISYLTARLSRDLVVAGHQQITQEWWEFRRKNFDLYISQLVLNEAGRGDKEAAENPEILIQTAMSFR